MRKLCMFLALSVALSVNGQTTIQQLPDSALTENDSIRLLREKDSVDKLIEKHQREAELKKESERNINSILALQKKRDASQKRGAILRIAFGLAMLLLLVVGLNRKKKKR